jgi:opacity protein-like surface antigen
MTKVLPLTIAALLIALSASAQEYEGPLTVEGLNQQYNHSVRSAAFGNVTIGSGGDVAAMFRNPASLHALPGIQISVGGLYQDRERSQVQQFAPVRYYPNLSLLLEGLTASIPDPDPDLFGFTPADTVQRPYDNIQPRWSQSANNSLPMHATAAVPFTIGGVSITAGVGAAQYANLDYYQQNNNVLDPAVLSQRPLPTVRPTDDNPVTVGWYQSTRSREGTLYGYGAALAGHFPGINLTVGLSGMLLDGESDDFERLVDRGTLTFFSNAFRADSSFGVMTATGTSQFSGTDFSAGATLHGEYVSIGVVVRPPAQYKRSFTTTISVDTTGVPATQSVGGEDRFELPWRGYAGLLLTPRDGLSIGIEYERRPFGSATFTDAGGNETSPWVSAALFRVGVQYELTPWLALRAGMRGDAEVFVPDGSPLADDPVSWRVYSVGIGVEYAGVRVNAAFESAEVNYQDLWGSAISSNTDARYTLMTEISYNIPFNR